MKCQGIKWNEREVSKWNAATEGAKVNVIKLQRRESWYGNKKARTSVKKCLCVSVCVYESENVLFMRIAMLYIAIIEIKRNRVAIEVVIIPS